MTDPTPLQALQQAILNLPCNVPDTFISEACAGYRLGHRDARHAAVELVAAALAGLPAAAASEGVKAPHEQMMAGYEVACRFGVYERRAFDLAEQMWQAMLGVKPGWKLVPVEPTEEMLRAVQYKTNVFRSDAPKVWSAMLAASPSIGSAGDAGKGSQQALCHEALSTSGKVHSGQAAPNAPSAGGSAGEAI